jgi:signal transduction histidine kinase/ActR/RegA family two-component response regulator
MGDDAQVVRAATAREGEAAASELAADELPAADRQRIADALQSTHGAGSTGAQAYPLRDGERVLGVLLLAGEPTALGLAVLDEVAIRAAIAFAAARLYQSLQDEIQERRRAEARLEEANKRKDEFLAMLSHELRNPLAPIGNAVEIIRRLGGHDAKLMWATDITDRQLRQLTRLVDELLDVARIGQGKIVLQSAPLELTALVAQCLDMQRAALSARRQTLTQAMPGAPVWIHGDGARMQQVINNLLSNANKYTPEGGSVHVAVTQEPRLAVLTVRDNGMGIESDLLPRVFDLFEQGKRALDRNQGGLGVGLTLVQRLVKLHDGRVEAHSAGVGQGAEFRVYLPRLQSPGRHDGDSAVEAPAPTAVCRRLLIVEDNPDIADTTATMLAMAGHTVRCARDGVQALEEAQSFAPEVVLLDVGLPELDGYQVARRLRQLPQTRQALIIGLTGYGMPADRQRGREAGFDHHLLKPADPNEMRALIEAWSADGSSAQAAEPKASNLYAFKRP